MSDAAVVADPGEAVVETNERAPVRPAPPTKAVFQSAREGLTLVMEKDPYSLKGNGEKDWGVGKHVAFVDGHLRVPLSGMTRGTRGEQIDAKLLLLFLEGGHDSEGNDVLAHPMFNNREEGFWRHYEPAPAVTKSESDELLVLAEERDLEGIEVFIERERDGWNRPELLKIAEGTRDRVHGRIAAD